MNLLCLSHLWTVELYILDFLNILIPSSVFRTKHFSTFEAVCDVQYPYFGFYIFHLPHSYPFLSNFWGSGCAVHQKWPLQEVCTVLHAQNMLQIKAGYGCSLYRICRVALKRIYAGYSLLRYFKSDGQSWLSQQPH